MSDNDEVSKYIGGDKNIEISKDVEDLFRLMLLNDEVENPSQVFSPDDILSYAGVQKECRRSLSTLHQKKTCIFRNTLLFKIDSDTVEFGLTKKLADPNLVRKWADSCKTDILGIPFGMSSTKLGHANMVVVNKKLKTIEHFEPHGEFAGEEFISEKISIKFKSIIKNFFKKCCFPDYKYVEPKDVCPIVGGGKIKVMGVQTIQNILDDNKKSNPVAKSIQGSCAWWSMWYLNVRIVHPELSANEAYDKAFRTMLNVREGQEADLNEVESFIVTFMKKLLTLANFTLTSHKHSKEDKTINEQEKDLINKGFYIYDFSLNNNKKYRIYTKISPEILYSEKITKKKSTKKKSTKKKSTKKKSTEKKSTEKKCPEGKIVNPATGRCVSKTGKIGRDLLNSKKNSKKSKKSKKSVKCVKGKIINPKTNRCVSKTGKIGRSLK